MHDILTPSVSAELISNDSENVLLSVEGIERLARKLLDKMRDEKECIHPNRWKLHPLNPKACDDSSIDWIFLVDALNFSFWSEDSDEKYTVHYGGNNYTGYWSLCAAINRALDEGVAITSAAYCRDFSIEIARHVFRSDSAIGMPLLEERVKVMNEIGQVLLEKFDGKFTTCVTQAEGSAQKLLEIVVSNFPCFRDEGVFKGQKVSFYKRAQILVADLWACFGNEGLGKFADIDTITMFADYRIPQILKYFDAISYSSELTTLLQNNHMFENGDMMEMEVRGVSIQAVELLVKQMRKLIDLDPNMAGTLVNAVLIDHFLWDYRRKHDVQTKHIPFHKVRCIYY